MGKYTTTKHSKKVAPKSKLRAPRKAYLHDGRVQMAGDSLNDREKKILATLRASDAPLSARELQRICFPGVRVEKGTYENARGPAAAAVRAVRNGLRRLVAGMLVSKVVMTSMETEKKTIGFEASG